MKKRKKSNFGTRMAAARRRKSNPARRRKASASAAPRRRRRRSVTKASAAPRRRRRRNPPTMSMKGLVSTAIGGAIDGALVVAGKTGVRLVSQRFKTKYPRGTMMCAAIEVAGAVALGVFGRNVIGEDKARMLMAGGFGSVIETFAKQMDIPKVSELLGATDGIDTIQAYAQADANRRLAGYSRPSPATLQPDARMNGYAIRSSSTMQA